jgi:hypothetical protein
MTSRIISNGYDQALAVCREAYRVRLRKKVRILLVQRSWFRRWLLLMECERRVKRMEQTVQGNRPSPHSL